MAERIYEKVIIDTVDWFIRKTISDSTDWHDSRYGIPQVAKIKGRARKMGVGIPMSAEDAWLSFSSEASDKTGATTVLDVECIRSDQDGYPYDAYV